VHATAGNDSSKLNPSLVRRPPDGDGQDDDHVDGLTADRLEEDWEHALDAADHAATTGARSHTLRPDDVSTQQAHIREERTWLAGIKSTLRKLLPRRNKHPSDTT
jgi:hypothetical protein